MATSAEMLQALLQYMSPRYNIRRDYFLATYLKASGRKKQIADVIIRQLYDTFLEVRTLENIHLERIHRAFSGGTPQPGFEQKAREKAVRQLTNEFGPHYRNIPILLMKFYQCYLTI